MIYIYIIYTYMFILSWWIFQFFFLRFTFLVVLCHLRGQWLESLDWRIDPEEQMEKNAGCFRVI